MLPCFQLPNNSTRVKQTAFLEKVLRLLNLALNSLKLIFHVHIQLTEYQSCYNFKIEFCKSVKLTESLMLIINTHFGKLGLPSKSHRLDVRPKYPFKLRFNYYIKKTRAESGTLTLPPRSH